MKVLYGVEADCSVVILVSQEVVLGWLVVNNAARLWRILGRFLLVRSDAKVCLELWGAKQ